MRPIQDPQALAPGATLFHTAFGFARVVEVGDDAVALEWERASDHLPRVLSFDAVGRAYSQCEQGGFFDRALTGTDALREALHASPGDAVVALLDDLGGPQRVRDIMDWCVGRGLLTPKTFVRWWGLSEAHLRDDPRLALEGEWVRRVQTDDGPLRITQLEPDLAEFELDGTFDTLEEDTQPLDEPGGDPLLDELPGIRVVGGPIPMVDTRPSGRDFIGIGQALAQALAQAHAEGRSVRPNALTTLLHPDGTIHLADPPDAPSASSPAAFAHDVAAAASLLLEAFTGRSVPSGVDPADVLPHLRHRVAELPPSALAPLTVALAHQPDQRPDAATWLKLWKTVAAAELDRQTQLDVTRNLVVGYDTHIGRVKLLQTQINQDCLYLGGRGPDRLLVLADGISVSDAGRGDLASRLATQAIGRLWENVPSDRVSARRLLDRALHLANRTVCERALRAAGGDLTHRLPMGTTILIALTHGNLVHLAWLGDSRAYLLGEYGASLLTSDDNVSGERFLTWCDGLSRNWNANGHALVRYLGHFDESWASAPHPAHHIDFVLRPGERLILCSDGITDYIDHHEPGVARRITECCAEGDPDEAARRIVSLANRLGGGDNASVFVAACR